MSFKNDCRFIGNLGADPEIKTMNSGDKVANLRIAVSETWKDKQTGERKERTEWIPIVIWNESLIGIVEKYCHKGDKIGVSGEFKTRKWQDQSGNDRYSTEIVLEKFRGEIMLLGSKDGGQNRDDGNSGNAGNYGGTSSHASGNFSRDLDDEITF